MLKIRQDQIFQMMEDEDAFVRWYLDVFMPEHLPVYYHSPIHPESRKEMVIQGRLYANQFGLFEFPSLVHFITMMFNIGPNFFVFPGFREALQSTARSENEVIDRMYAVNSSAAAAAMKGADDRYWWPNTIPRDTK